MKNTYLSNSARHSKTSIDLPSQRVWVRLEEYGVKSSLNVKTGPNFNQIKKAEDLMDQAFDSILKKLVRQN